MSGQSPAAASKERKLRICAVSLYSYPLFNPACISPFGGSEVRISLIARELAKYPDLDVHLVVFDHGQPKLEVRDGVTLHSWSGKYCPIRADHVSVNALVQPQSATDMTDAAVAAQAQAGVSLVTGSPRLSLRWHQTRLRIKSHSPRFVVSLVRRLRPLSAALASFRHRTAAFLREESLFGSIQSHAIRLADVRIYDEVGADIYLTHGNHDLAAALAYYCRKRGRKYVMLSASDHDFIAAHDAETNSTDMYGSLGFLLVYTVKNADLIFVQTGRQAELARTYFGRDTIIIPNPVDLTPRFPRSSATGKILWVGKSDDLIKQPELFVDLAHRKPEYEYLMIMNLAVDSVHRRILEKSRDLSRLKVLTYVPFDRVEKYFAEAALFVNTSAFEGFPNTFLQAMKYGVPVVSLMVDPDGMLARHGCGAVCDGDFDRLEREVSLLMSDRSRYLHASDCCRAYLARYHDKDILVPKYREALLNL